MKTQSDLDYFDKLPPRVRSAMNECPIEYTAVSIYELMAQGYTSRQIIKQMEDDVLAELGYHWSIV